MPSSLHHTIPHHHTATNSSPKQPKTLASASAKQLRTYVGNAGRPWVATGRALGKRQGARGWGGAVVTQNDLPTCVTGSIEQAEQQHLPTRANTCNGKQTQRLGRGPQAGGATGRTGGEAGKATTPTISRCEFVISRRSTQSIDAALRGMQFQCKCMLRDLVYMPCVCHGVYLRSARRTCCTHKQLLHGTAAEHMLPSEDIPA
jgi:hypothetical protein